MPPRYAYWTILIDGKATAFRAREREELLPTFNQLARKNADIVMRYFARGRLWDNPEQAQWANRNREVTRTEPRNRDWRPGGQHKDPRARFERKPDRSERPFHSKDRKPFDSKDRRPFDSKDRKPIDSEGRKPFDSKYRKPAGSTERKPFQSKESKPYGKPSERSFGKPPERRFKPADWREPKSGAPAGKRPRNWSRPPKRKPR
jgi:hypothetical protein